MIGYRYLPPAEEEIIEASRLYYAFVYAEGVR